MVYTVEQVEQMKRYFDIVENPSIDYLRKPARQEYLIRQQHRQEKYIRKVNRKINETGDEYVKDYLIIIKQSREVQLKKINKELRNYK